MCLLECDSEEGVINEQDQERIQGDQELYLDDFNDPFLRPTTSIF